MKKNSILQLEYDDAMKLDMVAAKRAARAAAIHDPNRRNIAVDVAQCELQIKEKMSRKAMEKEAEKMAAMEARRINRIIAQAELDEADKRREQSSTVRASWKQQSDRRNRPEADIDPRITPDVPIVAESCGLAAGQCFAGEDRSRFERKRLQARQITLWSQQQQDEKAARAVAEKQEDIAYARYIDEVGAMRAQMEKEDVAAGAGARITNRDANLRLAGQQSRAKQKAAMNEKRMQQMELQNMQNDPFINEQPKYFTRADFKGFSAAERAQVQRENADVLAEQQAMKSVNNADDQQWTRQFHVMNKEITRQDIAAQDRAAAASKAVQQTHLYQKKEAAAREQKNREDARGEIGGAFFGQFGTSHR